MLFKKFPATYCLLNNKVLNLADICISSVLYIELDTALPTLSALPLEIWINIWLIITQGFPIELYSIL